MYETDREHLKDVLLDDTWKGSGSFVDRFPRLFALENDKQAIVVDRVKDGIQWSWHRPIRDGREAEEFE